MLERSWKEFYSFLSKLPDHSDTRVKMAEDPKLAEAIVSNITDEDLERMEQNKKVPDPPLAGYTPEVEKLNQILDAINLLRVSIQAMVTKKGKKAPEFEPARRPKTATAKLIEERKRNIGRKEAVEMVSMAGFSPDQFGFSS